MAQELFRWGSFVVLVLALASWCIALGGLSAINWMACTDIQSTRSDIATSQGSAVAANAAYFQMGIPAVNTDVAVCSRSWCWEWWTLFFELAILTYGMLATLMPNRLPRACYAVAQYLVIATVLVMVALNDNINDVWFFWDTKRMFNQWTGAMQKLYLSAAALVAGWILVVIFNFVWIGFGLDCEVEQKKAPTAAPADVEAPQAAKK